MNSKPWSMTSRTLKFAVLACIAASAWAGTFGKVVSIGGHASDLALDESRGLLYVSNFTANRVEVVSLGDNTVQRSINVASQPSSLAISPDGKYLVVAHYGNFAAPLTSSNALTVINLETGGKQTFALGNPPLGVGFGIDNKAFVATTKEFLLFDPVRGSTQLIDTITGVAAKTLPQPTGTFPPSINTASVATSRDGLWIFGSTDALDFRYDVNAKQVLAGLYTSSPANGPRAVSVNSDGTVFTSGWALQDRNFNLTAQFPNPIGTFNLGTQLIDSSRGLIYAQMPDSPATGGTTTTPGATTPAAPTLQVVDSENLAVLERLILPENLGGKSVLSGDNNTMYSVSDSGVVILPVGALAQARRLTASQEDVVFRGNFCDRSVSTQEIVITDRSGAATDFSVTSSNPAVRVSPSSGTTPARVRITVDPSSLQSKGTTVANLDFKSTRGVNLIPPVRVSVNTKEPDQRGSGVDVPGKLVDILSDPTRDRFFVIRQDKNQVLVFDGTTYKQIATLKTGNTPTQMAITFDRRNLLIGSDNSQILYVYDLETLEAGRPVRMPGGHYPRSIASSANATLIASRVAGPKHQISRLDLGSGTATPLPSLGIYNNDVNINTVLIASPNGSSILAAQPDGNVMLYNATADTFAVSRKDASTLGGAYAASSFDQYVVGNNLLNSSLVQVKQFETATGLSSGFAFVDQGALRITAPDAASPGVIQRVNLQTGDGIAATRTVEAPILGSVGAAFTRTLAPLYSRKAIVALTTSGFTILPWDYDASVAPPRIDRVVNAADFSQTIAPGGLISVFGSNLSPVSQTSSQLPVPTALGESCLTVNGIAVPMLFVSSQQINAQLPFPVEGNTTLRLNTPGGVSDNFNLTILPSAPSVFRASAAGSDIQIPTIVRALNNEMVTPSNPVHRGDTLVIYATGLGRTSPAVDAGVPTPSEPLSSTIVAPTVTIGGVPIQVQFAGLTPGYIGLYQINAVVGRGVPVGLSVPLNINQGAGATSVSVRVVE
jgi:uncharacterized protein (TIGR03437 family)